MRRIAQFMAIFNKIGQLKDELALEGWISVESSMIARVRYTTRLEVEFVNGGRYAYDGVSLELFEDMLKAESVGKYFNNHVKNAHPYKQLEPAWTTVT